LLTAVPDNYHKALDTRSRNRRSRPTFDARFGASFSCRCTTSNVVDCLRTAKAVNKLEVVHLDEKLAPESGIEVMAPISGACVRGIIQHVFISHSVSYGDRLRPS